MWGLDIALKVEGFSINAAWSCRVFSPSLRKGENKEKKELGSYKTISKSLDSSLQFSGFSKMNPAQFFLLLKHI